MKNAIQVLLPLLLLGLASSALAVEPGDLQLRVRAIGVVPDDSSGEVSTIADSGVGVDSAATLEVDLTVFVHEHVALEIIAATASHDINGRGSIADLGRIGDTSHLPPTITVQYHFNPDGKARPYVGAGINYTTFYDEDVTADLETALGGTTRMNLDDSWGWAVQAGVDVAIGDAGWFFNFDVKYLDIDTTAHLLTDDGSDTRRRVDVSIDPWIPGVGFGYRW